MAHVGERLADSTRLSIDAGVSHDCLVVRGDPEKLAVARSYPDVKATRAAFLDVDGQEIILTDDVMVCFSTAFDDEARRKLCDKLKCQVVTTKGDTWKLRVLGSGLITIS